MVDVFSYMCIWKDYSHICVCSRLILMYVYIVPQFSYLCI